MDTQQRTLNLPASMSEASLRLDNFSSPTKNLISPLKSMSPRTISNLSASPSKSASTCSDRFIPCRSSSRLHTFGLIEESPVKDGGNEEYTRLLKSELFGTDFGFADVSVGNSRVGSPLSPSRNMLRFKTEQPSSGANSPYSPSILGTKGWISGDGMTPKKTPRKVPKTPHKVLDAPALQDDFYLNLVDWSSQNVLAVGLGTCVYLWNASNSKVIKLCDLGPNDSVCSVQWTREGSYISVGTNLGLVQVWDTTKCKCIRTMGGHETRAGILAWSSRILASGSRDRNILLHDPLFPQVCGLKWSLDDRELASMKYSAVGLESTLAKSSFEVNQAYSSSESNCLVTSPKWSSCIWRWNGRSQYSILEHCKWEST